ncbi:hypothetical protein J4443_03580 [Candidatus Woesearchaeota archaeon]|nr:hypothetical protein [Candidatus Woesearchaeota archaeon]
MEFSKKEIKYILVAAIIAAFVFSFNEWGIEKFNIATGIKNLFIAFIFCSVIYFLHSFAQKLVADYYEYRIEFTLIDIKRRVRKIGKIGRAVTIPIGPIITLLLVFISAGKFIFLLLNSYEHISQKEFRIGRQWVNLKEFEEAQIALAGPLSQIVLLIIFKLLLPFSVVFNKAMFITSVIAIYHMLPLPKVDGSKIFFGSRSLYIASLVFIVTFIILIFHLSVIQTIILALLFSTILGIMYLYKKTK